MLKPLNQPRLSPVSTSVSPRFQQYQYGISSPRINTSIASRKASEPSPSPSPIPAPSPNLSRKVKYVSRGTQYSPKIRKMNNLPPTEPPLVNDAQSQHDEKSSREKDIPSKAISPTPTSPSKPVLVAESPNLKRHNRDEASSTISTNQSLHTKRVRPAQAPVKVLPAKYEFCEVEDMVILIANMISELIQTNDELPLRSGVLTRFHSR